MAIKVRKQAAASVEIPPDTHLQFFVDTDGLPKLKDSLGNVTDAAQAGQVTLSEQLTDPPAVADKVKLYSKDVDGIAEFFARDDQGNVIQITSNGALNAGGSGTYLDGAQYAYFDLSLGNGVGPYEVNTGIIPALTPNSIVHVRIESAMALENVNQDAGFTYIQFGWGVAPTLPIGVLTTVQTGGGLNGIVSGQFNSVQLNASGEIVLAYNSNAPNEMLFIAKVAVYQKVLPFAPTFPV